MVRHEFASNLWHRKSSLWLSWSGDGSGDGSGGRIIEHVFDRLLDLTPTPGCIRCGPVVDGLFDSPWGPVCAGLVELHNLAHFPELLGEGEGRYGAGRAAAVERTTRTHNWLSPGGCRWC